MKYYVLFNPLANNGRGGEQAKQLDGILKGEVEYCDVTKLGGYAEFAKNLAVDDVLILTGGDGTINRFANDMMEVEIPNEILYYAAGSGNDFLHDLEKAPGCEPFSIKEYIKNLPTVTVNGKTSYFINGIGYGIDGYCCEVGDEQRAKSDKPVNYTGIAIKGLLFHFKPKNAKITVDGKEYAYKKVWLAPTMNGRFYGGGMMVAPNQDRKNKDGSVSVCVMYGTGKLKTLIVFPSIFKGAHVRHTEMFEVHTGHEIKVEFDAPCALQIDGETVLNVTEYTVKA